MGKIPGKYKSSKYKSSKDAKVERKAVAEAVTDFVVSPPVIAETYQNVDRAGSKGNSDKVLPLEVEPLNLGVDSLDVTCLNLTDDASREKREFAITKAQAAFRGYLARRAFRSLKGIIRLQALIRGCLVRRQSAASLRCMQEIVKPQALAHGQNLRFSNPESHLLQIYKKIHTGTTVIGFLHRGRAIIAADSLLTNLDSNSREAIPGNHKKTENVSENIIVGFSGSSLHFIEQGIRSLITAIQVHGKPILVIEAATFLLQKISVPKDYDTEMIVAGYDTSGTRMFHISKSGGVVPGTRFFLGSGRNVASEIFNRFWLRHTSLRDGDMLVKAVVCQASDLDPHTGQCVRVSSADKDGHEHSPFLSISELKRTGFRDTRFAEIFPPEIEMEDALVDMDIENWGAVEGSLGIDQLMEYYDSVERVWILELAGLDPMEEDWY